MAEKLVEKKALPRMREGDGENNMYREEERG